MTHSPWTLFLATVALGLFAWPVHSLVHGTRPMPGLANKRPPLEARESRTGRPPARNRAGPSDLEASEEHPVIAAREEAAAQSVVVRWSKNRAEDVQRLPKSQGDDAAPYKPIAFEATETGKPLGAQRNNPLGGPHRPTTVVPASERDDEAELLEARSDPERATTLKEPDESDFLETRSDSPERATTMEEPDEAETLESRSDNPERATTLIEPDGSEHLEARSDDPSQATTYKESGPGHPLQPPTLGLREQDTKHARILSHGEEASMGGGHPPAFTSGDQVERPRVFRRSSKRPTKLEPQLDTRIWSFPGQAAQ